MASCNPPNRAQPQPKPLPQWPKPPVDYVKLNWDASLDTRRSRVGIGVVASRDHAGSVVAVLADSKVANTDPVGAETLAAWHAAELCLQLGLQKVLLEGDALEVVQALRNENNPGGRLGHVLTDATAKLGRMQEWSVEHILREANKGAHSIAKLALCHVERHLWVEGFPPCIHERVLAEQALV